MDLLIAATVCAAVWYMRYRYHRLGAARDLKLFILLWIGLPRTDPQHALRNWCWPSHFFLEDYSCSACASTLGFSSLAFLLLPYVYRKYQENKIDVEELEADAKRLQRDHDHGPCTSQYDPDGEWNLLKPILFPCRTSHTRLFPRKHAFAYSYLFVGIPVGWRGWVSSLLTADLRTLPWRSRSLKNGWFNVDSADYLARGDSIHGLRGKLDTYLESQVSWGCMSPMHTCLCFRTE